MTSQVLDIHDGELLPTLENRRLITRVIREWNADLVISHRPWDYLTYLEAACGLSFSRNTFSNFSTLGRTTAAQYGWRGLRPK